MADEVAEGARVRCPSCAQVLPVGGAATCPSCRLPLTGPDAARLWQVDQQLAALGRERLDLLGRLRSRDAAPAAPPVAAAPATSSTPAPAPVATPAWTAPAAPAAPAAPPTTNPYGAPHRPSAVPPTPVPPTPVPPTPVPPTPVPPTPVPPTPVPATPAPRTATAPPPQAPPPPGWPAGAPERPRRQSITAQRLLLVTGVVLVLVAAVVFLTVSWRRIGVGGQVGVMGLLTALSVGATFLASRRDLRSSAEALSVLAGGLLLVDLAAARALGMAGLDEVSGRGYTAVTGLLAGLLLAGLHLADRRIKGFAVLAMTAFSVGAAGVAALADSGPVFAWVAAATAGVFGLMAVLLPHRAGSLRTAAGGPAATWLLLSTVVAAVTAADRPYGGVPDAAGELASCGLLLGISVAGTLVVRRVVHRQRALLEQEHGVGRLWLSRIHRSPWRALSVVAGTSTLAAVAGVLGLGVQLGDLAAAVLSALLVVAVAVVVLDDEVLTPGRRWALGTTLTTQVLLVTVAGPTRGTIGASLLALAASVACTAVARAGARPVLAPLAAVVAAAGVGTLVEPYGRTAVVSGLAAVAVATAAVAGWRRGRAEEVGLGGVALLAFLVAAGVAAVPWDDPRRLVVALGALGLTAVGYAALPDRRPVVALGVAALSIGLWIELGDHGVSTVEAYSLPTAVMLLAAGWWVHRWRPAPWQFATPAVGAALLPSAVAGAAVWSDGSGRALVALVLGVLVASVGLTRRWTGWLAAGVLVEVVTLLTSTDTRVTGGAALVALALTAAHAAVEHRGPRPVLAPLAVLLLAGGVVPLVRPGGLVAVVGAVTVVGVAAIGLAAVRRGRAEEVGLGVAGALVTAFAAGYAFAPTPDPGRPYLAATVLVVLALAAVAYAVLPGRRPVVTLAVVAATAALWVVLDDRDVRLVEAWSLPPAVPALAAALWVRRPSWPGWLAPLPALVLALAPSAVAGVVTDHPVRPVATAAAASLLVVAGARLRWPAWWGLGLGAQVVVLLGAVVRLDQVPSGVVLLLLAVGVGVLAHADRSLRAAAVPLAAALAATGAGVLTERADQPVLGVALVLVGAVAVALGAWRRTHAEESGTAAVGALTLLAATATALAPPTDTARNVTLAVVALTVLGALATAYAGLPGRRPAVLVAVPALNAAVWTGLLENGTDTIEAYTLPLAALLLGAGLWLRRPGWSSWFFTGPAVLVGLLPSAVVSIGEEGALRPLLTIVAAAAVLAVGVARRWQSLVLTGGAVTLVVGVSQLLPYYSLLPRWVTLAVVGIVLLVLGIRYESTANGARRTIGWMGDLG